MGKFKEILELVNLSRRRFDSKEDYIRMQYAQAKLVYGDIEHILKVPSTSFVVDFGCGGGGYTSFFATKFREVLGLDFNISKMKKGRNISFCKCNLLDFRLKKKADFIFCASVIEHVEDADKLIKNIYQNLKPGGYLYLSFPPFYSLGGGHTLKPFHYLPEHIAIKLARKFRLFDIPTSISGYPDLFGNHGLYKRSISNVKKLLIINKFKIISHKTRYFPINTAMFPIIGDFLTWHVEFYCRKI